MITVVTIASSPPPLLLCELALIRVYCVPHTELQVSSQNHLIYSSQPPYDRGVAYDSPTYRRTSPSEVRKLPG